MELSTIEIEMLAKIEHIRECFLAECHGNIPEKEFYILDGFVTVFEKGQLEENLKNKLREFLNAKENKKNCMILKIRPIEEKNYRLAYIYTKDQFLKAFEGLNTMYSAEFKKLSFFINGVEGQDGIIQMQVFFRSNNPLVKGGFDHNIIITTNKKGVSNTIKFLLMMQAEILRIKIYFDGKELWK